MSSTRPLVVIDDPERAAERAAAALAAAEEAGWSVVRDWTVPPGRRVVCTGVIAGPEDARGALLAAVAGAGLIAVAAASPSVVDQFLDQLRRLGKVDHVTADGTVPERLDVEQRALLGLLADGLTLGDAARELGLSRRTADRRIAAARRVLGVGTTAEAILASRR